MYAPCLVCYFNDNNNIHKLTSTTVYWHSVTAGHVYGTAMGTALSPTYANEMSIDRFINDIHSHLHFTYWSISSAK